MSSFGIFLFRHVGSGYLAANQLFKQTDLELVEVAPLGEKIQIIVRGDFSELSHYRKGLSSADILRTTVIEKLDQKLMDAYYGINTSAVQNFLLIIEGDYLGELLEVGQGLLASTCDIVDLRLSRSSAHPCCIMLTGQNLEKLTSQIKEAKSRGLTVTVIETVNEKLKEYF